MCLFLFAGGLMLAAQVAQHTTADPSPTGTSLKARDVKWQAPFEAGSVDVREAAGTKKQDGTLTLYPAIAGLAECADFTIEVDGRKLWVESLRKAMPEDAPGWFRDPEVEKNLSVNIASFGCSGAHTLTVKPIKETKIEWLEAEPRSRRISVTKRGNEYSLALSGPCKLVVHMGNSRQGGFPDLLIFANPQETDVPNRNDPKTRFFGPGVHEPGVMTLKDGDQIYLAPGAVVYGALRGSPRGAKIFGRGILDGSRFDEHHMIRLANASDVQFSGITIRCGRKNWTNRLDRCERFTYRNVKVLSFTNQGDGIDPCNSRHFLIDDCFLRCADDCIAVKAYTNNNYPDCPYPPARAQNVSGITVIGCVMAGYGFSDGFTIGNECDTETIEDIFVKDCDILLARGNNAFGGHAAFSVNCDGPAEIRNIRFENVRVGKNVNKNCQFAINDASYMNELRRTIGGPALKNLVAAPGHIKGVSLKNIQWEGNCPIILWSYDDRHRVEDVSFEGCMVEGKPLTINQIKRYGAGPATRNVTVSGKNMH